MVTTITSRKKRNRISINGHIKTSKPIVEYLGMEIDNKLVDRDTRTTLVQYTIYLYAAPVWEKASAEEGIQDILLNGAKGMQCLHDKPRKSRVCYCRNGSNILVSKMR